MLSLALERVGNYVFYSPMKSDPRQRPSSEFILVAASRAAEFCYIPRGACENDPLEEERLGDGRRVGISTGSVETLNLAKHWLEKCFKHHVRCPKVTAHSQLDIDTQKHDEVFCPIRSIQMLPGKLRLHTTGTVTLS